MTKKKTEAEEPMTAADLIQDEHNYRKHSETNKKRIRKSIDEAGLGRSVVVDADGVIIAGNGVQSVVDPDTPVRVIETDGTELVVVKRTDLHEGDERRKKLAMGDNAAGDDVEWDMEAIEADGWEQDELEDWGVVEVIDEQEQTQQPQSQEGSNGLPPELHGVDINPDNLPKLEGDDETLMERVIICYEKVSAEYLAQKLGLEKIEKVVYKLDPVTNELQ